MSAAQNVSEVHSLITQSKTHGLSVQAGNTTVCNNQLRSNGIAAASMVYISELHHAFNPKGTNNIVNAKSCNGRTIDVNISPMNPSRNVTGWNGAHHVKLSILHNDLRFFHGIHVAKREIPKRVSGNSGAATLATNFMYCCPMT